MISNPTISQMNGQKFMEALRQIDPELFLIKVALMESNVNAYIIPQIIRTIGNLSLGTGYGKIQIFMQARVITNIKPEESVYINEKAVNDPT